MGAAFQKSAFQSRAFQCFHAAHELELELAGYGNGFTDVTQDLMIHPDIGLGYGIDATGPLALMAGTGHFNFALNNGESNSAGKLGYYSPNHVNCRTGFKLGIRARYWVNGSLMKFIGRVKGIDPVPGQFGERKTRCVAYDYIDELANAKVSVSTQVNKRHDEVASAILATLSRQPSSTNFAAGVSTFPYSLDTSRGERMSALAEFQRLCQSEYCKGYSLGNGTLVLEKRSSRLTPMPVATFYGTMQDLDGADDASKVKNRAKVTAHPRAVGAANTDVLFSKPSQNNPPVAPGQTFKFTGRFGDPTNPAIRVGGTDMQAVTATTDYLMNAAADGSGADLTGNFTVTATYVANQVEYSITNNGGSTGYVTKLQARGRSLKDYTPMDAEDSDATSITNVGESPVTLDMVYQSDLATAQAVAEFIVDTWSPLGAGVEKALRFTPRDDDEFAIAAALEPGQCISVTEEVTAVNSVYFIEHVDMKVRDYGRLNTTFTWALQRAQVQNYWQLGVSGLSELGVSTVLAPL